MENSFAITFDYPLDGSSKVVRVNAIVDQLSPDGMYGIDYFSLPSTNLHKQKHSVLSRQQIKRIEKTGKSIWVHQDSEKPTTLAIAIGQAIDDAELARHKERFNVIEYL